MNSALSKISSGKAAILKKIVALLIIIATMPFVNACTKVSIDYTNLLEYLWLTRPRISVTGITLNKERTTVLVSGTEQLTALILPLTATNQAVTWTSSDAAVVAVTTGGLLNGVAAGSATVTATSADRGFTASCSVTVSSVAVPVASIVTNKKSTTILAGSAEQLMATILPLAATNQNVTWASSNPWIVTVGPGGLVSAVAAGSAVITVTSNDGVYSASFTVTVATVAVAAAGVTLNKSSLTLGTGSFEQLTVALSPSNATNQNITWTSSNQAVATVGPGGLVTAVAAGAAVITARTVDGGYTATCVVTVTGSAAAQWARTVVSATDASYIYNIAAASDGSVYAAGIIMGTGVFDFGNGSTATANFASRNCLLVKYDDTGLAQWAVTVLNGGDDSYFRGVAVASDGSVYAVGEIDNSGIFDFGNGVTATAPGGTNAVIVKYDSSGLTLWALPVTTAAAGASMFQGVAAAPDGSVYVAGEISGNEMYDFGNGVTVTGSAAGSSYAVLVKYDNSGLAQWAATVAATDSSMFNVVSVGPDGSVYAAGGIIGTSTHDFGNGATATGTCATGNIVVLKYSSSGVAQWARSVISGSDESIFYGISIAPDGSVYASGMINNTTTYDFDYGITATGTAAGASSSNGVLVKYDSAGVTQWAQTVISGSGITGFLRVSAAPDGTVFVGGGIQGTITYDFGNGVTAVGTYGGGMNPLLLKYSSAGVPQWASYLTAGTDESFFWGVSVAPDGSIYAGGSLTNTVAYDFGNGSVVIGPYTGDNILLVKYK